MIHKALDRAYNNLLLTDTVVRNIKSARFIIFSDQHRGVRDGADDFLACERTYCNALRYYFRNKYTLIILDDAEDLWECRHKPVIRKYENILKLEADFFLSDKTRYHRIYGNHDDYWGSVGFNINEQNIPVKEKMLIKLFNRKGQIVNIFLVHGHQRNCFRILGKWGLRFFWRPFQRITKIRSTTPANDYALRGKQNLAMYDWASKKQSKDEKLVLIAGHTHHPVFESRDHIGMIVDELENLEKKVNKAIKTGHQSAISHRSELEEKRDILMKRRIKDGAKDNDKGISKKKPCYFNTGCCSFSDGDITGIEISEGNINLVKWSKTKSQKKVLGQAKIFNQIFKKL
jgi:hypothetical protein